MLDMAYSSASRALFSIANIFDASTYARVDSGTLVGYVASQQGFTPTCLSYFNGTYHLFARVRLMSGSFETLDIAFKSIGTQYAFAESSNAQFNGSCPTSIAQAGANNYIVATTDGIYRYEFAIAGGKVSDLAYKVRDADTPASGSTPARIPFTDTL